MSASPEARSSAPSDATPMRGRPFSWRFTTPLFIGSALNPVNSSLIATALLPIAHGIGAPIGEQLGTASGQLRTFGYVGSIGSSAITGIVFHTSVSDDGVHLIGWIMIGVSLVLVLISVLDRTLPGKTGS